MKGGSEMTNIGGRPCCNACVNNVSCGNGNGIGNYSFILVLFILLVICGTAFVF